MLKTLGKHMDQFLNIATSWPIAILTLPLCLLIVWWMISLIGIFDFDTDIGVDANIGPLVYAGIGKVPLKIGLSIWVISSWLIAYMLVGAFPFLVPAEEANPMAYLSGFASIALSLVVAMPITKLIIKPLIPLFSIKEGIKNTDLIGCGGIVISPYISEKYGDVEVLAENGHRIRISAVTYTQEPFQKGDKIVVVSFEEDLNKYVVTKTNEI